MHLNTEDKATVGAGGRPKEPQSFIDALRHLGTSAAIFTFVVLNRKLPNRKSRARSFTLTKVGETVFYLHMKVH